MGHVAGASPQRNRKLHLGSPQRIESPLKRPCRTVRYRYSGCRYSQVRNPANNKPAAEARAEFPKLPTLPGLSGCSTGIKLCQGLPPWTVLICPLAGQKELLLILIEVVQASVEERDILCHIVRLWLPSSGCNHYDTACQYRCLAQEGGQRPKASINAKPALSHVLCWIMCLRHNDLCRCFGCSN